MIPFQRQRPVSRRDTFEDDFYRMRREFDQMQHRMDMMFDRGFFPRF